MSGGGQPLRGRKIGDRRVRVERPHAQYFRWSGKGTMTAKAAASTPTTGLGARPGDDPPFAARPAPGVRGGDRRAAVEEEGPRDLQLGRDLVLGLCDRGDPARPHPGRGGRPRPRAPGFDRDLGPPDRRRVQLSTGLPGVSQRRRLVLGLEAELRTERLADRGLGPPHRLRHDRRRVHDLGRGADHVGASRSSSMNG